MKFRVTFSFTILLQHVRSSLLYTLNLSRKFQIFEGKKMHILFKCFCLQLYVNHKKIIS